MRTKTLALLSLALTGSCFGKEIPQPAWGRLQALDGHPGTYVSQVPAHPKQAVLALPTPFPHIVRAQLAGESVPLSFNEDATEISLAIPAGRRGALKLEIAENSGQLSDGRIVFSALDAKVNGATAKLESHPGSHRIGFWSDVSNTVSWDYKASRWGMYEVSLTYSLAAGSSKLAIEYGGEKLEAELTATGSWYSYRTISLGRLYLAKAGRTALKVVPISKTGAAVMNLKAVLLDPAPEGEPIVQDGDAITLHARDSTIHGVMLRYEPNPKKLCMGYWANPADWASWDFTATEPGRYQLIVRQGCGNGHGGRARILLGDQAIEFEVEQTGGFQNWKDRELGMVTIAKPGPQRLEVRPLSKKGGAVMDIQQVQLVKTDR